MINWALSYDNQMFISGGKDGSVLVRRMNNFTNLN